MSGPNTEAWREADRLIRAYGDNAAIEAAMLADQALDEGDVEAFHNWQRVVKAINGFNAAPAQTRIEKRQSPFQ